MPRSRPHGVGLVPIPRPVDEVRDRGRDAPHQAPKGAAVTLPFGSRHVSVVPTRDRDRRRAARGNETHTSKKNVSLAMMAPRWLAVALEPHLFTTPAPPASWRLAAALRPTGRTESDLEVGAARAQSPGSHHTAGATLRVSRTLAGETNPERTLGERASFNGLDGEGSNLKGVAGRACLAQRPRRGGENRPGGPNPQDHHPRQGCLGRACRVPGP